MTKRIKPRATPSAPQTSTPYLRHPGRVATILGSFLVLALPLAALQLLDVNPTVRFDLSVMYAALLGGTHFLITLAVYLHRENLRYFASSGRNILVYFITPALILALFFVISAFELNKNHDNESIGFILYLFLFTAGVRLLDFLHVTRQSFGMLQLFKSQAAMPFPHWMRRADNAFFVSMAGLQLLTFVHGMRTGSAVFAADMVSTPVLLIVLGSLVTVLVGFRVAARQASRPGEVWLPFTYFLFQAASASLAAWRTELYTASLAMHYVEYHIIIFPRLFKFELDPESRVDRIARVFRRHKFVFYVGLGLLACFVSRDLWPALADQIGSPRAPWLLFNLLNGIFVTHYFIEMFIWKFRNPYYRQSLGPLYFAAPSRAASTPS